MHAVKYTLFKKKFRNQSFIYLRTILTFHYIKILGCESTQGVLKISRKSLNYLIKEQFLFIEGYGQLLCVRILYHLVLLMEVVVHTATTQEYQHQHDVAHQL